TSCVVDGELVAGNSDRAPNVWMLPRAISKGAICIAAFDLLMLNGIDARELPLSTRKNFLRELIDRSDVPCLMLVDDFPNGDVLLAEVAKLGLEGVVAKRRVAPYRPGSRGVSMTCLCQLSYRRHPPE